MWLGEFSAGDTVDFKFTTRGTTGAPSTLGGTPALSVYKANGTTESTAGITLTADFDARTGLNHVRITTNSDGTFYADGNDFQVVITTGTVGGTSVVGEVVGHFTLRNRAGLKPTTPGRTLDVSVGGEGGVDWANVGSPTTTVGLSGTTVGTLTTYTGNTPQTGDAFARLGAPAGASHAADVAAVKSDTGAIKTQTDKLLFTAANYVKSDAEQWLGATIVAPNVAGVPVVDLVRINGTVVSGIGTVDANVVSYATGQDPAGLVLNAVAASYNTAGSVGQKINSAGSAGNPWTTDISTGYTGNQAGAIVFGNLDAKVSLRLPTSGYTAPDNAGIAAIAAKTTNLPASPAAVGSAMTLADGSITSAKFTVAAPAGVASGILEKLDQVWRRLFKPASRTPTQIKTFADNGTTVLTTQAITDDGAGNETQGAAT